MTIFQEAISHDNFKGLKKIHEKGNEITRS